ncbi:MAG: hypothetical protein JNJ59_03080 [Deltaproteobacteria bacterium]|nr:hypothetical protein [Deltaproteobacteria bacterium]
MHRLRLTCSTLALALLGCSSSSPGLADEAATATGTPLSDATARPPADPTRELRPSGVGPQLAPSDQKPAPIVSVETPWPRVLPCEAFSEVTFEVFDAGGTIPPEPRTLTWRTDRGASIAFRATRSGPAQVADAMALGPNFPSRALSRLDVPAHAAPEGALVNLWLRCAGTDGAGIEWVCKRGERCTLGVVYPPASAAQWPAALEAEGALSDRIERLLKPKDSRPTPLGRTARDAVSAITREVALGTRAWLDAACVQDRCPSLIMEAGARLTRFIEASATRVVRDGNLASPGLVRIVRADQRQVLDNEHYRAGYPRLEVEAEAGAETVSLTWERPEDWRLSFGEAGPGRVTCASDGCAAGEVSVGSTLAFHFYHPGGFGVRGAPVAVPAH